MYRNCLKIDDFAKCSDDLAQARDYAFSSGREFGLAVGLIPIPLAWGAAYICLWLTRWVRRGFQKDAIPVYDLKDGRLK